jgi:hypothetical protein
LKNPSRATFIQSSVVFPTVIDLYGGSEGLTVQFEYGHIEDILIPERFPEYKETEG